MNGEFSLENRIKAELVSYDGHMSVYLDDLRGTTVAIDADKPFEAASCIKVYILGALYDLCEKGELSLTDTLSLEPRHLIDGSGILKSLKSPVELSVKNVATLMTIVSDNAATNMLIEYVGLERINDWIRREGFAGTTLHNPIDFERYERLGTTTPRDYGVFFSRLAKRTLVSPAADAEMHEIFGKQHYNTMLTSELPAYYLDGLDDGEVELVSVASKSGSMNACRNDGGIVTTPFGSYVIAIMTSDFHDPVYHNSHPSTAFGAKICRLVFERYTALEGRL